MMVVEANGLIFSSITIFSEIRFSRESRFDRSGKVKVEVAIAVVEVEDSEFACSEPVESDDEPDDSKARGMVMVGVDDDISDGVVDPESNKGVTMFSGVVDEASVVVAITETSSGIETVVEEVSVTDGVCSEVGTTAFSSGIVFSVDEVEGSEFIEESITASNNVVCTGGSGDGVTTSAGRDSGTVSVTGSVAPVSSARAIGMKKLVEMRESNSKKQQNLFTPIILLFLLLGIEQ